MYQKLHPTLVALTLMACGCAGSARLLVPDHGFVQPLGRAHPLVGQIYAVRAHQVVTTAELDDAVAAASFLVLGETHDNRDHHLLEAKLTDRFLRAHSTAAVGFEMLSEDVRPALRQPTRDPDALARAVKWDESGWPEFSQYRPVFEVALARGARIIAAHPSSDAVRASLRGVSQSERSALHLDQPLPAAARTELREEIRASHCGHAPEPMLDAMERAQSYKDAFMARSIFEAKLPAVLVTGGGHARNDRAVPYYLGLFGAANVVSVAFIEVDDARTSPASYDLGAFDYAVFTPRVSDEDPCERFKEELRKMTESAHPDTPEPDVAPPPSDQVPLSI